ncbi:MAG: hypothetical protein KC422_02140 [Trueperaceae bacterium]|nr:hypothetical protein [Trueperaceae bacterium]
MRPFFDEKRQFYWLIKGRYDQGIAQNPKIGETFTVEKKALFHYPVAQVLPVCTDDFEALMYARVLSYKQTSSSTLVTCQVIKLLTQEEKTALTKYLQTTAQLCDKG